MTKNIVSEVLRGGLYTRVVGRRFEYFQSLPSTMDEAKRLAEEGAEEGMVVLAEEQTAGRGRFRREWMSPAGNLYLSVLLRPNVAALPYLTMLASLAVARAVTQLTGLGCTIKWPNDVRVSGRKVSGILVESALNGPVVSYAVVGIGINVAFDPATVEELAGTATGLDAEARSPVDRTDLLRALLQEMDLLYGMLRPTRRAGAARDANTAPSAEDLAALRAEWRSLLDTLGSRVEVRWQGQSYIGRAEDVDPVGNLLLRQDDGEKLAIPAGDVLQLREAPVSAA